MSDVYRLSHCEDDPRMRDEPDAPIIAIAFANFEEWGGRYTVHQHPEAQEGWGMTDTLCRWLPASPGSDFTVQHWETLGDAIAKARSLNCKLTMMDSLDHACQRHPDRPRSELARTYAGSPTNLSGPAGSDHGPIAPGHHWEGTNPSVLVRDDPTPYAVALARALDPDHAEALRDLMSRISERAWAARWINGLEYDLWTFLLYPDRRTDDYLHLEDWERAKLLRLSEKSGGWWHWPQDAQTALFIPRAAWLAAFEAHTAI